MIMGHNAYLLVSSCDNAGNLTQQTDAKGQIITFAYDNQNRLTSKKQGSTTLATYGYDVGTNGKGQRTSMTSYVGETNSAMWVYDARGRVTDEYRTVAAGNYRQTYTYDILGNLVQKAGVNMGYGQGSGIATTAKPHAVTHLNSTQKFWYDHNGNMTA